VRLTCKNHTKEPSINSWTGVAIWSETNFGPTVHHHPPSCFLPFICAIPSASAIFFKCSLEVVFCDVLSTAYDSASIVSKWRPFSFIFNWGNWKLGWVRDDSHVVLGKKIPRWKEVWVGALSRCNSQFFRRQSSERSLRTLSRSRHKTSQYVELTVWPSRTNSLWTIRLMSK
jgi:hypothetical protein